MFQVLIIFYLQKKIGFIFKNKKKSLIEAIKIILNLSYKEKSEIIKCQKKYVLENYSEDIFLNKYKNIIRYLI